MVMPTVEQQMEWGGGSWPRRLCSNPEEGARAVRARCLLHSSTSLHPLRRKGHHSTLSLLDVDLQEAVSPHSLQKLGNDRGIHTVLEGDQNSTYSITIKHPLCIYSLALQHSSLKELTAKNLLLIFLDSLISLWYSTSSSFSIIEGNDE